MMAVKKLFIAGAKCVRCGAEDRTRLCRDGEREWIECVACGFSEERPKTVVPHDPPVQEEEADSGAVKWFGPRP